MLLPPRQLNIFNFTIKYYYKKLINKITTNFSYKNYKQMKGRFLRANALKKNLFIHMVVDDGVDKDVYNNIMNKQDFSFKLYEK